MTPRLLILSGLLACQAAWALNVTTEIDRDSVDAGESVVVSYEVDEQVPEPDFSPLEQDFDIVSRSMRQSLAVGSGQDGSRLAWTLMLMPKGTGELTLPAIRFGDKYSDTLTVTVQGSPGLRGDDVYVEYAVDDPTPHVNQQVLLTTRVYTAVDVEKLEVSSPHVVSGRASVDKLGGEREFHTVRGGRRYAVREQRYTLVPESSGELVLGRVAATGIIGGSRMGVRSERLEIEVVDTSERDRDGQPEPEELFIETEVDKRDPYVQQQVLYTVRLYRSIPIENANLSNPSVDGGEALIERIERDRRYQTMRDDRRYAVVERRFALFPQTTGVLTLEPVELRASVPLPSGGSNSTGFWNRPLTTPVQIKSRAVELQVRPPPESASEPWLPARSLRLEEQWPDDPSVDVGTPVSRRVVLEADGLLASQLPDLEFDWPDTFKSYAEQPVRRNDAGPRGVAASLQQSIAVIPAEPGTVTVPAFELRWWNTATDNPETLKLPARTLEVTGGAPAPVDGGGGVDPAAGEAAARPWSAPVLAWWLSAALSVAWLATLLLWLRDRSRIARAVGSAGDEAPVASRRRAESQLGQACRAGDPRAARDALLLWGRARWPDRPPHNLGALGRSCGDAVAGEVDALQQALYAPGGGAWDGDGLYQAIKSFSERTGPGAVSRPGTLKPLYQQ